MKTLTILLGALSTSAVLAAGPTTIWHDIPAVETTPPEATAASVEELWGDTTPVSIKGITFGMTKQEVARLLGNARVPLESSELPSLFVAYPSDTSVERKLVVYFGTRGAYRDRVVGIETTFYKTLIQDRDAIVDTLEKKFKFADNYATTCPRAFDEPLKNPEALPQHDMKINEKMTLIFRTQWDNRRQHTYIVNVFYKHALYDEALKYRKEYTEEQPPPVKRERNRAVDELL